MKFGVLLHADRGVQAVIEEAKLADDQGFDSVWLGDHIMNQAAPLDSFTLMTAIGASTERVRLAWSMLNVNFRYPAVLAKVLATLDQITEGRVICSIGSGSNPAEHVAYNIPVEHDHDARVQHAREVVQLLKELWTHPAPATTTFTGQQVQVTDLAFGPEPYQKPHPPIWLGGESDSTLQMVKDLADGWVTLTRDAAHPNLAPVTDVVAAALAAPDWPSRPMTVVLGTRIFVASRHEDAVAEAKSALGDASGKFGEIVGTADECLERIAELERIGFNYLRTTCADIRQQEAIADLLLGRVSEAALQGA
jgi:alkanesulfonate monooxygenase SsuD/methylene tetrahydromethanopterin reductase-like flavin-dependent oxidoreductase (luciferase family)